MGLRPNLIVRQVFRTAAPVVPLTNLPTVLVGIHRQLEYRQSAGDYVGGQDNGDYYFPNLIATSEVEPTDHADTILRPQIHLSNQFGVADITDDVTFFNLSNPATTPYFQIDANAETVFNIATGTTGNYSSTTGLFTDANADFISNQVATSDHILINGNRALKVTTLDSDDQLTVTKVDYGPDDARVRLSAKDTLGNRTLDYLGTAYTGFQTNGTRVGDIVTFNGWSARTSTGGMSFTATSSSARTVTATGLLTGVVAGQVITTVNGLNDEEPVFITNAAASGGNTVTVNNIAGATLGTSTAVASADSRFFKVYDVTDSMIAGLTNLADGYYTAKSSSVRTFTDVNATFTSDGAQSGDWIVAFAANSGLVSNITVASRVATRDDGGSFIADGFEADMKVVCVADENTGGNEDGVFEIESVTASTITFKVGSTPSDSASGDIHYVSLEVRPLFEVSSIDSETQLTVTDFTTGPIPDAQIGGPLVYSIITPAVANSGAALSPTAYVEAVSSSTRSVRWPAAFTTVTVPSAGDYVYNDEGVLLFSVTSAVDSSSSNLTFATAANDTITSATLNFETLGFEAGQKIHVVGAAVNAANRNVTYTIQSVSGSTITLVASDTVTAEGPVAGTVQSLEVVEASNAPVTFEDADVLATIGLTIRQPDAAQYGVLRVLSDTQLQVRELVSGDEVTDKVVNGLVTAITVPNTLTNVSYTLEKALSGAQLSGDVLVTYAARRQDLADSLIEVNQGNVASVVGAVVPANPLGFAAQAAVNNTPTAVYLVQVADDTETDWAQALDFIKTDQVYNIVPLTQDEERLAEFRAHVTQQSAAQQKRERILWQSHRFETQTTRWTMGSGESGSVTYTGTPLVQTVTIVSTSGLVGLGVQAGDNITAAYSGYAAGSGFVTGTFTARVATVSEVGTTTTLVLVPDITLPESAAGFTLTSATILSKTLNTTQLRDTIAAYPATIKDRRVRNIYPDRCLVTFNDETDPNANGGFYNSGAGGEVTSFEVGGWYVAAIEGAKRSGVNPSSPLKGVGGAGVQRLVNPFAGNVDYLDTILDNGNYLMTQPGGDGSDVETVRGVTTDVTDLNFLEDAVTVQLDNFARRLRRAITPILGTVVLDDNFFDMFSAQQEAVRASVLSNKEIRNIKLISLREDPNQADTFLAEYEADPYFSAAQGDITIYI